MYRTKFVSFLPLSGILFFLLFLFPAVPARSCTVSIITQDGRSLTVNQEDWGGPWAEWKPEQAALLSFRRQTAIFHASSFHGTDFR